MTRRRRSLLLAATALAVGVLPGTALAHSPNPIIGTGTWPQDGTVNYTWSSTQTPPSWMAAAIDAGAADVGRSRKSRAAFFVRKAGVAAKVAYGAPVPCSSYGIACMDRSDMPDSFGMWFRPYGWAFDWGTLRWCQGMTTVTNGCYDAENVALDEFGHVEILDHHVNYADESDFTDSVVQFAARSRPRTGWDQHVFGRCDVARLQLEYDVTAVEPISTCLSLSTSLTFSVASTVVVSGSSVGISGTLRIASSSAYKKLSTNWLSNRAVVLQQRAISGTTWATIATVPAVSGTEGLYALTIRPTKSYDYRLVFNKPSSEGLLATTSSIIRIETYVNCASSTKLVQHVACG